MIHAGQYCNDGNIVVNKDFIYHFSGWFKAMDFAIITNGNEVRLPGDSPATVNAALQFFAFRQLHHPDACPLPAFDWLIDLAIFAVEKDMPLLENAVNDTFAHKIRLEKVLPDTWTVEYLWRKLRPGASLKRMLVALVREMWIPDGHRDNFWPLILDGTSESPELLVGAIEGLYISKHAVRVSDRTLRRVYACEWHVHEKGAFCAGSEDMRVPDVEDTGPEEVRFVRTRVGNHFIG